MEPIYPKTKKLKTIPFEVLKKVKGDDYTIEEYAKYEHFTNINPVYLDFSEVITEYKKNRIIDEIFHREFENYYKTPFDIKEDAEASDVLKHNERLEDFKKILPLSVDEFNTIYNEYLQTKNQ